jgi:hypothetical protein
MSAKWMRRGLVAAGLAAVAMAGSRTVLPVARALEVAGPAQGRAGRNASAASIRRPQGLYAVVVIDDARARGAGDVETLVNNPAIAGLAVRVPWSALQPAKDKYDFSILDAAFASAAAKHKTVQLIVLPGFWTPSWVLDELVPCNDLGPATPGASSRGRAGRGRRSGGEPAPSGSKETSLNPCGKASFSVSEGARHGEDQALPLPWNPVYKKYWRAFLAELAARYATNDAFVSIAVTGPTAESAEIILPRAGDQLERWAEILQASYHDPSYHRTDKAFVEEWDAAVTMFGDVFRNVTLVLTRGSGLLNFSPGQANAAHEAVVTAFGRHAVGANMKATQTSGLKACRETRGGIVGVKEMSSDRSLSPPILGGAQFDTSFSQKPSVEGCPASCDGTTAACRVVTPRDALANVLAVYFDETPAGSLYGASKGATLMNYLQVYDKDVIYAGTQPAVQALLEQASQRLLMQAR